MMNLRTIAILAVASAVSSAIGAVTVTPQVPNSADTITIRAETPFGSATHLDSASLNRTGNAFDIEQNVFIWCDLPQSTLIVSQFSTGPLPAGVYDVTVHINLSGPPHCGPLPTITQTATFTVAPDPQIPTLDWRALILLGVVLAALALRR